MPTEPYEGHDALIAFDKVIEITLERYKIGAENASIGPQSDMQAMAGRLIPQITSLAFAIRFLIRDGFLFPANVLIRPLTERVTILMYLDKYPEDIEVWKRGWKFGEAPSLSRMFDKLKEGNSSDSNFPGWKMTADLNDLVHGKPDAAFWNRTKGGYLPSTISDNPELCGLVCKQAAHFLAATALIIGKYFPSEPSRHP